MDHDPGAPDAASPRDATAPRALFLGSMYAGHATRFLNLQAHTSGDPHIRPSYRQVTGWRPGGIVERLPLLPGSVKGRLRSTLEAAPFVGLPRPDIVWSSAREVLTPYLWSQLGRLRRPLVLDFDWTLEQQEEMAPLYYGRPPKRGLRLAAARMLERALWSNVTMFTPWSSWAAKSLRRQGVPSARIRVIHPGVDLERWRPQPQVSDGEGPLRLLFVGGDFVRKGGDMLVELVRSRFAGRCQLDIVTRDQVEAAEGVRVHRAQPNSAELKALYAQADLFVMPSRAECFGIATVEAMASALPAVVSNVGGARDIVDHAETGWLIEPSPHALADALEVAVSQRDSLSAMGRRARAVVEERFDGRANDRAVVDTLLQALAAFRGADGLTPVEEARA